MRKTKKMLALALASALMVTSVQVNWDVTAYAAVQEGAETNGSRQAISNAIAWNMDYLSNEGSCEISDQNVPTTKMEYTSGTYYVSSLNFPNLSEDMVQFDAGKLSQVLEVNADQLQSLTVNDLTFRYRWSKAGDDGSYVSIEETTDTYDADEDITNENHTTTYRCTAIVTEVGGHKVPEGTDIPLTWDFVYQYTGVTKDQIDSGEVSIADHFEIEDFTSDAEIIRFASKSEEKNPSYFYINGQDFDDDRIDCKLSCIYKDGTEEQIQVLEDRSSLSNSSFDALTYSRNGKDVDHYNLHIDLKYGKQVLQSMDKVYNLEYTGITKEDVEQNPEILNTYFEGLKDLTDQDLNFTNVNSSQSAGCEIDSQFYGNATINYEWIAHAVDGTTDSVISRTSQNSCASRRLSYYYDFSVKDQQGNITDTERKPVDYYELSVVL